MKKIASFALATVLLASCQFVSYTGHSQNAYKAKGPVETKAMDLKDFNAITINGHADILFTQGPEFGVEVTTHADAFEKLDYYVQGSTLVLQTKDKVQLRSQTLDVVITAPTLTAVEVNGAADLKLGGYESDQPLKIEVNGAGDMNLNGVTVPALSIEVNGAGDIDVLGLDAAKLSLDVNGAGDAKVSGKAGEADIQISGAGDIDVRGLQCENLNTRKSGLGKIKR